MQYWWIRFGGLACLCSAIFATTGCGGSGGASSAALQSDQGAVITGSVGDGPVVGAMIEVVSADGVVVAQAIGGSTSSFRAFVPPRTPYPIKLRAVGGTDLVVQKAPDFTLEAVVLRPDQRIANLSPFSTVASRGSSCSGRQVNRRQTARVWQQIMSQLNMGYDMKQFGDPVEVAVDSGNVAQLMLASEALGETIRRTRAALPPDEEMDSNAIMQAISCDIAADGALDGAGVGAERRVTATFLAASAGVLVETVAKTLRVDGRDVMSDLDAAVAQMGHGDAVSVRDVALNPDIVASARGRLALLLDRVPGDTVARLLALLDTTPLASVSRLINDTLDGGGTAALDAAAPAVATDDVAVDALFASSAQVPIARQPVLSLAVTPQNVRPGDTARLSWASDGARSCWASGGWDGEQSLQGDRVTGKLMTPSRYALTCSGLGGTARSEVTLAVAGAVPPPPPGVSLTASPPVTTPGGTVTLAWTSRGADQCTADGDWAGSTPLSGSRVVGPVDRNQNYALVCTGSGGAATDVAQVSVATPTQPASPVTASLQATPAWISPGGSVTLSWNSAGATGCSASGAWSGAKTASGSVSVGPLSTDSGFTLSCTGPGGNSVASTTVSMRAARLSWQAPDSADPVAGQVKSFKIYYGNTPGQYGDMIVVPPTVQTYQLALNPGTYYFTLAPTLADGQDGARSNEVSKTIE